MTPPDRPTATVAELIGELRTAFSRQGIDNPGLDARLLVGGLLGLDGAQLVARAGEPVGQEEVVSVRRAMADRLDGKPVHRILGAREFYGLTLALSDETLEPRPDTETLVEAVIPLVRAVIAKTGQCAVADLGVGTGAIGLAILAECPGATCMGIDRAPGAVATARENAHALGLSDRYHAVVGDWFSGISDTFDMIVSNPPYIRRAEIEKLAGEVRLHDPILALDGGPDGLDAYRTIAAQSGERLRPGGHVLIEIGAGQSGDVSGIFAAKGFAPARISLDLAGIERVLVFDKD